MAGINPAPSALSVYRRTMIQSFSDFDMLTLGTLFLSLFGRSATGSKTSYVDTVLFEYDIQRATQEAAPLVPRGMYAAKDLSQDMLAGQKFTTSVLDFPLMSLESAFHAAQLNQRQMGQNVYAPNNEAATLREWASGEHKEHVRRMTRRMELMAAQSILTGSLTGSNGSTYDWNRHADLAYTTTDTWDAAGTKILDDLDLMAERVRQKGNVEPDFALMSAESYAGFLVNTTILAVADNLRVEQVYVKLDGSADSKYDHMIAAGAKYRGAIGTSSGHELALFTYPDGYTSSGTFTKYLSANKVVVGSTMARADRAFGPFEGFSETASQRAFYSQRFGIAPVAAIPAGLKNAPAVISPDMFKLSGYESPDGMNVVVRTQCAPLFIPTQTDAWGVITTVQA